MESGSTSARSSDEALRSSLQELCALHNAMPGRLRDYDCPECRNKGWIYRMVDLREVARECGCMAIRGSIRRMKNSGLYDRLQTQTFETFRADEAWQRQLLCTARQYAGRHDMPGFFIGGQQGAGKTHLCTAIGGALLRQGFDVQYIVWETYVREILAHTGVSDRSEYDARMRPLTESAALVLDDFMRKDCPSQAERSVAFDVINRRYAEGRITVISSEHRIDTLLETDQAVASRIKEMCGGAYCLNIRADTAKNYRLR